MVTHYHYPYLPMDPWTMIYKIIYTNNKLWAVLRLWQLSHRPSGLWPSKIHKLPDRQSIKPNFAKQIHTNIEYLKMFAMPTKPWLPIILTYPWTMGKWDRQVMKFVKEKEWQSHHIITMNLNFSISQGW